MASVSVGAQSRRSRIWSAIDERLGLSGLAYPVPADANGIGYILGVQTQSLTYTFAGSGPFAFACHVAGHYEAGMKGSIVIQP